MSKVRKDKLVKKAKDELVLKAKSKPGPKPFLWNPEHGDIKNEGHKWPTGIHTYTRLDAVMAVLNQMAADPEYEAEVFAIRLKKNPLA